MSNNAQLQIQFPVPGEWGRFKLTAVYRDAAEYTQTRSCTQDDMPADQAPALASVVSALVGLAEPWQASQVWARLGSVVVYGEVDGTSVPVAQIDEVIELTVEAINDQGGRRMFTTADYPEFTIVDDAAVEFFMYFTSM